MSEKKKVAISACLLGKECRYDATDNYNEALLKRLDGYEMIPFCPEDHAFGSPRPTMDLVQCDARVCAISNESGEDLSAPIIEYAKHFFDTHPDISLFIGKDKSPSCGVCTARLYDRHGEIISSEKAGIMAQEALAQHIPAYDAELFLKRFDSNNKEKRR